MLFSLSSLPSYIPFRFVLVISQQEMILNVYVQRFFSATIYRCSRLNKRYWVTRSPKNFLSLSILAFKCECNQRNDCLDNSIVLSRFLIMISLLCISLFDLKIPSHLSVFTPLECAPNFISTHRSKIYISK